MRRFLTFDCAGVRLQATLDDAKGPLGLLIVSGGRETRNGPRGVQSRLAQDLAALGIACLRFDRRGVGDSAGADPGFDAATPDIQAALQAFRSACPALRQIAAYGNCDAATALLLAPMPGIDQLLLSNIWIGVPEDGLPPPPLLRREIGLALKQGRLWSRLWHHKGRLGAVMQGAWRAVIGAPLPPWAQPVATGLARFPGPIDLILAQGDMTAQRFLAAWPHRHFATARAKANCRLHQITTDSHSFAQDAAYPLLRDAVLARLGRGGR